MTRMHCTIDSRVIVTDSRLADYGRKGRIIGLRPEGEILPVQVQFGPCEFVSFEPEHLEKNWG